jgi:hypothetical protein
MQLESHVDFMWWLAEYSMEGILVAAGDVNTVTS